MILARIACALLAGFAIFGVVWASFEAVYAHASKHWPRTPGSIITSRVSVESDGSLQGPTYVAEILYRYVVDGHEYTCDRVRFGSLLSFALRRPADSFTKRFPVGAPVTVAYDPANPLRGVLEPGHAGQTCLKALVFAIIAAVGLVAVVAA